MLLGNLFNIINQEISEGNIFATIDINPSHNIFSGHFPGQPVVPGVCMMQIVKELLQSVVNKKIQLLSADYLKFLMIIDPLVNPRISAEISYENDSAEIRFNARLFDEGITYFKSKGIFINKD